MGLGCAALTSSPSFPTYPAALSPAQIAAGLSSPATAITLLGKGGAGLLLLLLFMAVTSSTSAELIAVSSLLTFDVYKTYMRPRATSAELVAVSHYGIAVFALVLAVFCCILNAASLNLTWLLTCLGIIVGGASIPVGLILLWPPGRMTTRAAVAAPWVGFVFGLVAWMVTAKKRGGNISVATTGDVTNAVAGNIASWAGGAVVAVALSLLDGRTGVGMTMAADEEHVSRNNKINGVAPTQVAGSSTPAGEKEAEAIGAGMGGEKTAEAAATGVVPTGNAMVDFLEASHITPMDPALVRKAERLAWVANSVFLVVAIILVPFTLFGTEYIFSRSFFTGWIVVSFIWVWCSMVICVIWPVWESRSALASIVRGMVRDMATTGRARRGQPSATAV